MEVRVVVDPSQISSPFNSRVIGSIATLSIVILIVMSPAIEALVIVDERTPLLLLNVLALDPSETLISALIVSRSVILFP